MEAILEKFRNKVAAINSTSAKSYHKAVAAISTFLKTRSDHETFSEAMLADWFVFMHLSGNSLKTCLHYLDIISSLHHAVAADDGNPPTSIFKDFKSKAKALEDAPAAMCITESDFQKALSATKMASRLSGTLSLATDLLLLSLIRGARPLAETAMLKKGALDPDDDEVQAIVARQSSPRKKYVFTLGQAEATPRQLAAKVAAEVRDLLRLRGLAPGLNPDDTVRSLWAYAALKCGAPGSDVVAALGGAPAALPVLSLCQPRELPELRKEALRRAVAEMYISNPMRWYAMRLRPRVKFEDVERRFSIYKEELRRPEIYYPYEEIARRTGKKLIFEKKPFISDVVFFHTRITDILPLFSKIGDIAWCYTTNGRRGGQYAEISTLDFRRFQQTVGQFTPEYEVGPLGQLTPREDEEVVVMGGLFDGRTAGFKKIDKTDAGDTLYRLRLIGDNGIEWRIGIDSRRVKRLTPSLQSS